MTEKEITTFIFRLFVEKDSLGNFEDEVRDLFALCENEDERYVVKHILRNLMIVNESTMRRVISSLVNYILKISEDIDQIAIVAMAYDEGADSSQQLLQSLKPRFYGNKKINFFNSVPNFLKKGKIDKFEKFIIIDDFSGTGGTVKNRVNHIIKHAVSIKHSIEAHVGILFGMSKAIEEIRKNGISVEFMYECTAGISGHFFGEDRDKYIASMKRLEDELSDKIDEKPMPSLGYGEAESLFCIENQNSPNSNFPILWWPKSKDYSDRRTILRRFEP